MDLVRPIANKGHHIYCDSFFSSPALFKQLVESGTYACRTVKTNRKCMPLSLRTTKLKTQREMVQLQKGVLQAGYCQLVLRPIGPTTHWSYGPLVLQPIGPRTHWSSNSLVLWPICHIVLT